MKAQTSRFAETDDHYIVEEHNRPFHRFNHIWYTGLEWIVRETDLWGNLVGYSKIVW